MAKRKLVVIISTSTDRRTEHIGGYFMDVRESHRDGRQLGTRVGPKSYMEGQIATAEAKCPPDAEMEVIIESIAWNKGEELGPR